MKIINEMFYVLYIGPGVLKYQVCFIYTYSISQFALDTFD